MKKKIILTTAFLGLILFFTGLYTDNYILRMISKPIPLLALMLLLKPDTPYRKAIFTGLVFSVMGDVLLESSPDMFLFGLLSFLSAQIAYIVAFTRRNRRLSLLPALFLFAFGAGYYWFLFPGLENMAIPVLVYLIVILTMAWRAIAQRKYDKYAVYALAGSLFFVFSDSMIALDKFHTSIAGSRWIIMISYWTAQYLIFTSAYHSSRSNS